MIVQRLDHVNIFTDRLAETAQYYADLLGLEIRGGPPPSTPENVLWMYDHSGQAILHLNSMEEPRAYDRPVSPGGDTGAIHHVALLCNEFVICPPLSGPETIIVWTTKGTSNAEQEAQAGRDHRQAA